MTFHKTFFMRLLQIHRIIKLIIEGSPNYCYKEVLKDKNIDLTVIEQLLDHLK